MFDTGLGSEIPIAKIGGWRAAEAVRRLVVAPPVRYACDDVQGRSARMARRSPVAAGSDGREFSEPRPCRWRGQKGAADKAADLVG